MGRRPLYLRDLIILLRIRLLILVFLMVLVEIFLFRKALLKRILFKMKRDSLIVIKLLVFRMYLLKKRGRMTIFRSRNLLKCSLVLANLGILVLKMYVYRKMAMVILLYYIELLLLL